MLVTTPLAEIVTKTEESTQGEWNSYGSS
jgi:hypothetical protein